MSNVDSFEMSMAICRASLRVSNPAAVRLPVIIADDQATAPVIQQLELRALGADALGATPSS